MSSAREIDLRDVVRTVLSQWWLVVGATLAAMLLAGLVAWGLLQDEYTSEVLLQFSKSKMGTRTNQEDLTVLQPETFIYYLVNNDTLQRAWSDNQLGEAPYNLPFDGFRGMVSASHLRNTNLIRLTVTLPEAKLAAKVAADLARMGVERNQQLMDAEILRSQEFLADTVGQASRAFEDAYQKLLAERLTNQVERWDNAVRQNGEVLRQIEMDYSEALHSYEEARARYASLIEWITGEKALPERQFVTQSIEGNAALKGLVKDMIRGGEKDVLPLSMKSEMINYNYTETLGKLIQVQSDMQGMQAKMRVKDGERKRMEGVQAEAMANLARARADEDLVYGRFSIVRDTLGSLEPHVLEAAARVVEERQDLAALDSPREPERPSGPPRLLFVLVAGMLGFGASSSLLVLRHLYLSA